MLWPLGHRVGSAGVHDVRLELVWECWASVTLMRVVYQHHCRGEYSKGPWGDGDPPGLEIQSFNVGAL